MEIFGELYQKVTFVSPNLQYLLTFIAVLCCKITSSGPSLIFQSAMWSVILRETSSSGVHNIPLPLQELTKQDVYLAHML